MLQQLQFNNSVFSAALLVLIAFFCVKAIVRWFLESRRIRKLGDRAVLLPSWIPGGLDIIYRIARYGLKNDTMGSFRENFRRAGSRTLELRIIGVRIITTDDPENIKALLATQFKEFGKGEDFRRDWHGLLGDSIFSTDGEMWHSSRQLLRPLFIKDRVSDLHTFEKHAQTLISKLPVDGSTVDICDLFFKATLDTATEYLLGHSVDSLNNPTERFAKAFAEVQRMQMQIVEIPFARYILNLKTYYEGLKTIDDFVNPFIEQALRLSGDERQAKERSDIGFTFLHALSGYTRDRKVLRDQLVATLIAGRDTTAVTLSWLFYEIAKKPAVVEKLRHEIISRLGTSQAPSYTDLKEMRYLQHTIAETLRLYPAVPVNIRTALCDTTLPNGSSSGLPVGVPKGTPIGYSPLTLHRRLDLSPPATEFYPERWDYWTPKPWEYIPFNGGPRICIGQQFALAEVGYFVVRILQRVGGVESREGVGAERTFLKTEIVGRPGNGVKVGFVGLDFK